MCYNEELLSYCRKTVEQIAYQNIVDFIAYLATERNYNEAGINFCISALKFLYNQILGKSFILDKKRPKKDKSERTRQA